MTDRVPGRAPVVLDPPSPGVVDVVLSDDSALVTWTPIVYRFAPAPGVAPFQLVEDVAYTVPRGLLPEGPRVVVPAGTRSDGPTLGRYGHVAAGLMGVDSAYLYGGSWLHDWLLHLIGTGALDVPRRRADEVARLAWLSTPGLDADDAEEAYRAVRLGSLHAEWAGDRPGGPAVRTALRLAVRYAPRVLPAVVRLVR